MSAILLLGTVGLIFFIILKKVLSIGGRLSSVTEYLFAHSDKSAGLSKNTTALTAIASNFQTANALFVGMWFGYNFGLAIAILSVLFASGIWLLYYLLSRLSDEQKSAVLQNTTLPYERIFGGDNKSISNIVAIFVYASIVFGAVTEIWFGSRMANGAVNPIFIQLNIEVFSTAHISIAVVGLVISAFLFFYVYFGGYRAVAETDKIQTSLIVAMLTILIVGVLLNVISNLSNWDWEKFIYGAGNNYANAGYILALFCGATVLNVSWQLVLPTQWQRAAAAESATTYVSSLRVAAFGTLGTWTAPVLVGAIAAAAGGANANGVPLPFQGWYDLGEILSIGAIPAQIIISIAIGIAVAGIFSAALSTADTGVIIVVAKLIQYQNIDENKLDEVRTRASLIVVVVCLLAGALYYFDPPIDKFIFAVSTAQILFAGFFWKYITSGGAHFIRGRNNAITVLIAFAVAFILSFVFNLVPYFGAVIPNIGFWFPLVVLLAGFWLSNRTVGASI